MITPMIIIVVIASILLGGAALIYAMRHMVDGYQDEYGFHEGVDPQLSPSWPTAVANEDYAIEEKARQSLIRAKRAYAAVPMKVAKPGSIPSFTH